MANTHARAQEAGQAAVDLSNRMKRLLLDIDGLLKHNTALAINWSDSSILSTADPPGFLEVEANGNIQGLHFTPADLANAINSFAQFRGLMTGQEVAQGDYLGNIEKLAKASA